MRTGSPWYRSTCFLFSSRTPWAVSDTVKNRSPYSHPAMPAQLCLSTTNLRRSVTPKSPHSECSLPSWVWPFVYVVCLSTSKTDAYPSHFRHLPYLPIYWSPFVVTVYRRLRYSVPSLLFVCYVVSRFFLCIFTSTKLECWSLPVHFA